MFCFMLNKLRIMHWWYKYTYNHFFNYVYDCCLTSSYVPTVTAELKYFNFQTVSHNIIFLSFQGFLLSIFKKRSIMSLTFTYLHFYWFCSVFLNILLMITFLLFWGWKCNLKRVFNVFSSVESGREDLQCQTECFSVPQWKDFIVHTKKPTWYKSIIRFSNLIQVTT